MTIEWVETKYCRLALGDCRELLPTLAAGSVDAVVTDPPYGIDGGSGGDARDYAKGAYDGLWEDTPEYIGAVCAPAVELCISFAEAVAVTPGIRCLDLYPKPRDMGCFFTPASITHGPWGFTTFQPILYYGKDWRAGKGALPTGRVLTESSEKNGHPCPKPVVAWTWLVDKVSAPDTSVLDPFMGSGTTAIACIRTGRKFIGCEIDPKYFQIALKRILDEEAKPDLFAALKEEPKAKAGDLFASLKEST